MRRLVASELALFLALVLCSCSNAEREEVINGVTFPVNESGDTYGSYVDANIPDHLEDADNIVNYIPDLISVVASNGKEGYVKAEDFISMTKNIDVYDVNGETVIGKFND